MNPCILGIHQCNWHSVSLSTVLRFHTHAHATYQENFLPHITMSDSGEDQVSQGQSRYSQERSTKMGTHLERGRRSVDPQSEI